LFTTITGRLIKALDFSDQCVRTIVVVGLPTIPYYDLRESLLPKHR